MNPYGHDQGQNPRPILQSGELWLSDIQSRLIFTREGGTVIPSNGDMPFHVNQAQVDQYFHRLQAIASSGQQAACVSIFSGIRIATDSPPRETLNQLSSLFVPTSARLVIALSEIV